MRSMRIAVAAITLLIGMSANAANTESTFDGTTGTIVLPHLVIGDQVFYVALNLVDAATLTFQVDISTAVEITPTAEAVSVTDTEIHGTWTMTDVGIDNLRLTFNADGSYEHFETTEDEGCTTGTETGTYAWEPSTGVLQVTIASDANGECGLSHPRGLDLIFVDGDTLTIQETGPDGETFVLTRVS